jgi:hypothetical protein
MCGSDVEDFYKNPYYFAPKPIDPPVTLKFFAGSPKYPYSKKNVLQITRRFLRKRTSGSRKFRSLSFPFL